MKCYTQGRSDYFRSFICCLTRMRRDVPMNACALCISSYLYKNIEMNMKPLFPLTPPPPSPLPPPPLPVPRVCFTWSNSCWTNRLVAVWNPNPNRAIGYANRRPVDGAPIAAPPGQSIAKWVRGSSWFANADANAACKLGAAGSCMQMRPAVTRPRLKLRHNMQISACWINSKTIIMQMSQFQHGN